MMIEEEKDVIQEEMGFIILNSELETAIKEMENGKAAGSDEIPAEQRQ